MDSKGERRCLVGRGQYEEGILVEELCLMILEMESRSLFILILLFPDIFPNCHTI